jgi:hypothetical protein
MFLVAECLQSLDIYIFFLIRLSYNSSEI